MLSWVMVIPWSKAAEFQQITTAVYGCTGGRTNDSYKKEKGHGRSVNLSLMLVMP